MNAPINRRRRRTQADSPQGAPAEPETTDTQPRTRPSRVARAASSTVASTGEPGPKTELEQQLEASLETKTKEAQALFQTAPSQRMDPTKLVMPDMQHGFQTIVRSLFEQDGYDVTKEWNEVRAGLEITEGLTPDILRRAANKQERLAERAHQLYIVAKIEVAAYLRETEPTYGAMRAAASTALEVVKAGGMRTKQITDADVLGEAARQFPDQWVEINTRREKAEGMLQQLKNLAELARARCYTVSNLASPSARFGS